MNTCQIVIKAKTPTHIPVADKPLKQGGKIENLTIEEFQKRLGCVYNDGISIDKKATITPFRESVAGSKTSSQLIQQVQKILKFSFKNLFLCKGDCGYGVFASQDIPKDTVVAIYSGTIINGHKVEDSDDEGLGYFESNMAFCTKNHRGIASFMQHLPKLPKVDMETYFQVAQMCGFKDKNEMRLDSDLYNVEFRNSNSIKNTAIENIRNEYIKYNNFPLIALVTDFDIKSGDQLGFNYGCHYWMSRNVTPEIFDKSGNTLSTKVYKRIFGRLFFENFSYTGEYKPLIEYLKGGQTKITLFGDDKKIHEVYASELLLKLLLAKAGNLVIKG